MADADYKNAFIVIDPINHQMGFERIDPNRRRNLVAFTRHPWIRSYKFDHRKKLIVIPFGDQGSERADALVGDRDDILFRFNREVEWH